MYPNKLTTNFTCHQFVLKPTRLQNEFMQKQKQRKCKYPEMYKIPNKYSNPNPNFKLVP